MSAFGSRLRRNGRLAFVLAATLVTALFVGLLYAMPESRARQETPTARSGAGSKVHGSEAEARRIAAGTGKPVEVAALRTTHSTTFALPDHNLETRIYPSAIRTKVHGQWQKIDTALHRTGDGNWTTGATNSPVVFSGGGRSARTSPAAPHRASGPLRRDTAVQAAYTVQRASDTDSISSVLATATINGHGITLTWPGALPEPVIDGSRALYPNVLDGVDLLLQAKDNGFSQLLIVKNAQAASNPAIRTIAYGLSSPDLTLTLDTTTNTVHATDATGHEVAVTPTPVMWDSAGGNAVTDGLDHPDPTTPEVTTSPAADDDSGDQPTPDPSASSSGETPTPEGFDPSDPPPATESPTATQSPSAPSEEVSPAPEPSTADGSATPSPETPHTGAAASLDLPGLAGPQPDSHSPWPPRTCPTAP